MVGEMSLDGAVRNLLPPEAPLIYSHPFRSSHHTISQAGLVGGGNWPRPGEISLAHRGVLFLDELPEFAARVLEVLRQPLEDRVVAISRARSSLSFPTNFMLVAAMNPCPWGEQSKFSATIGADMVKLAHRAVSPGELCTRSNPCDGSTDLSVPPSMAAPVGVGLLPAVGV
jgi:predicted ATPase with chaperone activity